LALSYLGSYVTGAVAAEAATARAEIVERVTNFMLQVDWELGRDSSSLVSQLKWYPVDQNLDYFERKSETWSGSKF